jgi:hypothetical protein
MPTAINFAHFINPIWPVISAVSAQQGKSTMRDPEIECAKGAPSLIRDKFFKFGGRNRAPCASQTIKPNRPKQ